MFKYYFIPRIATDDERNFFKPFRIVKLKDSFPIRPNNVNGYNSLNELRKNDKEWKAYYIKDSKSAEKICNNEFIISVQDFVLTPDDKDFNKVSFKLLKHTVFGELSNEITGIHLYSKLNKKITKIEKIKVEDKRGVWVANIEYYSKERNKFYLKTESTMFPLSWDPTTYMFEIYHAYINKENHITDKEKYHSTTMSGIPVEFIINEGIIRTVYPLYEI